MSQRPNIRTLLHAARAELEVARTDDRLIPSSKANCTKALPCLDRVVRVIDREENPPVYIVLDACRSASWELRFLAEPRTKNRAEPVRLRHIMALREAICDLRASDLAAMFPLAGAEKE